MGLYPLNHLATSFFDPLNAYKILNISGIVLTYLCTYLYARKITFNKLIPIFIALIFTYFAIPEKPKEGGVVAILKGSDPKAGAVPPAEYIVTPSDSDGDIRVARAMSTM